MVPWNLLETSISQAKRFGLKGCEALLPALWALTEKARHRESRAISSYLIYEVYYTYSYYIHIYYTYIYIYIIYPIYIYNYTVYYIYTYTNTLDFWGSTRASTGSRPMSLAWNTFSWAWHTVAGSTCWRRGWKIHQFMELWMGKSWENPQTIEVFLAFYSLGTSFVELF